MNLDDTPYIAVCDSGCHVSNENCLTLVYAVTTHPLTQEDYLTAFHLCPVCLEKAEKAQNYIGTEIDIARWMAKVRR